MQSYRLKGTLILGLFTWMGADAVALTPDEVFFEEKIRPILATKCYRCHSEKKDKRKGGLVLDSREGVLKGGDSGPVLVAGKPGNSPLLSRLRVADEDERMPPDEMLPAAVIQAFETWIAKGAAFPAAPVTVVQSPEPWWDRVKAAELPPASLTIEGAIDLLVGQKLDATAIKPTAAAPDGTYLRRVTLDLAGRIPSLVELDEYEQSKAADKKARTVDRLMKSAGFNRHQVTELDWLLMAGEGRDFRKYLERAVDERRTWDAIFQEVIVADEVNEATRHSSDFIRNSGRDPDQLVNDVSVRFFGVNISCAQCHDHPLVPAWKQDHYYGMKSFFSRTFLNGEYPAERDYGTITFKTTKGEEKQAKLMFLTGQVLDEPPSREPDKAAQKQEKERLEKLKQEKKPVPAPDYSRRAQLAKIGAAGEHGGFFARAAVNQVWYRLLGRGLVMPLDQMHGQNPPSHPELLLWLARDLEAHGYDLKRLIRGIVLSRTYARDSRWTSDERPDPALFAVAIPRVLTPQQMGAALRIAVSDPESFQPVSLKREELEKRVEDLARGGSGWVGQFPRQAGDFQMPVEEALFFSNNDRIDGELLRGSGGTLLGRILQTNGEAGNIRLLFRSILMREPQPSEALLVSAYLKDRSEKPTAAWQQIAWALLSGVEFRFNY